MIYSFLEKYYLYSFLGGTCSIKQNLVTQEMKTMKRKLGVPLLTMSTEINPLVGTGLDAIVKIKSIWRHSVIISRPREDQHV